MQAKLTLNLEEELIKGAKEYAKSQQKSLSQIVSEFFSVLNSRRVRKKDVSLGPVTSKLVGSLKGASLTEDDYKDYLIRKYLCRRCAASPEDASSPVTNHQSPTTYFHPHSNIPTHRPNI